ncbi:MAG: DNA-directed RNA polymerase subunit omega [Candidatus Diapherotrites archaeon]|nr:DNA-directed RNA polymerase subunit omega [Candidatus Diapherotrites archaeon]
MVRLTRFEFTRVLSARALQLSLGAPPLVKRTGEGICSKGFAA